MAIKLVISTPYGTKQWDSISGVTITLVDGELKVLPRHSRFVGALAEGPIKIDSDETLFVPGGLVLWSPPILHIIAPFTVKAASYDEYYRLLDEKYKEAEQLAQRLKTIKFTP